MYVPVDQDVRLTLNIDNSLMKKLVLKQSSLWFYDTWI